MSYFKHATLLSGEANRFFLRIGFKWITLRLGILIGLFFYFFYLSYDNRLDGNGKGYEDQGKIWG